MAAESAVEHSNPARFHTRKVTFSTGGVSQEGYQRSAILDVNVSPFQNRPRDMYRVCWQWHKCLPLPHIITEQWAKTTYALHVVSLSVPQGLSYYNAPDQSVFVCFRYRNLRCIGWIGWIGLKYAMSPDRVSCVSWLLANCPPDNQATNIICTALSWWYTERYKKYTFNIWSTLGHYRGLGNIDRSIG